MKKGEGECPGGGKVFNFLLSHFPAFLFYVLLVRERKLAHTAVWKLHDKYFPLLFTLFFYDFHFRVEQAKKVSMSNYPH
jgi:hypothetical protein